MTLRLRKWWGPLPAAAGGCCPVRQPTCALPAQQWASQVTSPRWNCCSSYRGYCLRAEAEPALVSSLLTAATQLHE